MRVNVEWLRDWVSIDLEPNKLAERLTVAGLEVDSVEAAAPDFEGVVVAEITAVEPHPNADRLVVCQVNDGQEQHTVVCGAPNATSGLRAPFAPVGALLPDGVKIRRAKLRGVTSNGMLCSGQDLGLSDESDGLLELSPDAPLGQSVRDFLQLDDAILDIDLTPNRGDCFSVLGIAREIAATQGLELEKPTVAPVTAQSTESFGVTLEAEAGCPRFVGRVIRGLSTTASTPAWLAERLRRAGLRAIHPVVDVTNYVMLELGQPLHSYDVRKLDTGIVVRLARADEKLTLLDGRARFDGRSSFRTFLFAVIRRTAAERRRRAAVRGVALARWWRNLPDPVGADPEREAARSAESRSLAAGLASLPARQRQVLHLVFYQDLSIREAAEVIGVTLGTARTHYERGKRRLRLLLDREER